MRGLIQGDVLPATRAIICSCAVTNIGDAIGQHIAEGDIGVIIYVSSAAVDQLCMGEHVAESAGNAWKVVLVARSKSILNPFPRPVEALAISMGLVFAAARLAAGRTRPFLASIVSFGLAGLTLAWLGGSFCISSAIFRHGTFSIRNVRFSICSQ